MLISILTLSVIVVPAEAASVKKAQKLVAKWAEEDARMESQYGDVLAEIRAREAAREVETPETPTEIIERLKTRGATWTKKWERTGPLSHFYDDIAQASNEFGSKELHCAGRYGGKELARLVLAKQDMERVDEDHARLEELEAPASCPGVAEIVQDFCFGRAQVRRFLHRAPAINTTSECPDDLPDWALKEWKHRLRHEK